MPEVPVWAQHAVLALFYLAVWLWHAHEHHNGR